MDRDREMRLAKAAVELGYLTSEQLRECMAAQFNETYDSSRPRALDETTGRTAGRPLGVIMVERGHLTQSQLAELMDRESPSSAASEATIVTPAPSQPTRRPPSPLARVRSLPSAPSDTPATKSSPSSAKGTLPLTPPVSRQSAPDLPEDARAAARDPKNLFGKFILVQQVGSGGFGSVYRAWQRDLMRWVALKFLHSEDPADIQRFVREAQTAAKLTHQGIVGTYEVSQIERRTYIAMEYVDGKPLSRVRLNPKNAIAAIRDAARAVSYAHEQGIVHRDLKPGNLLYDGSGRVKVMDFGLARNVNAGGTLTISGTIVGTPAYMSPEQARGDLRGITFLSDVYSLGASLYDLLTGHPPFEGATPYDIVRKVIDEEPIPPTRRAPRVHPEVETIILKAMDKDPARRYADAAEFADDLQRHLDGDAVIARPVGPVTRAWKKVRRNPVPSAAIALAILGIVGGATFGVVSLIRENRSMQEAARHAQEAMAAAKREAKEAEEKRKAVEEATVAMQKALESNQALASIAYMVTGVERLRLYPYRPTFNQADFERELRKLEELLTSMKQKLPTRPEPDYLLGRLYLEGDDLDKADAALHRALEIDPKFSAARAALGRVAFERFVEDLYLSMEVYEARSLIAARREHLERDYAQAMAGTWADLPGVESDRRILEVVRLVVADKLKEMIQVCEKAFEETGDEEFLRFLAFPYIKLGKTDDAIKMQTRALEIRPGWAKVYNERAVAYAQKGMEGDLGALFVAQKDLDRALQLNPKLHLAHRNNGWKLLYLRKFDESIQAYTEAIRLRPTILYYLERAEACRRAGRIDDALLDGDELVRRWPEFATSWSTRGRLRMEKGDVEGAEKDLKKALEVVPGDANTELLMAKTQASQGLFDPAIELAGRVIAKHPTWAEGYGFRAQFRKKKADKMREEERVGWLSIYLEVKEDIDAYFSRKPARTGANFDFCTKARADVDKALKSRE